MLTYRRVNEALNAIFFDGRFKLAPVYLDIEADIADELSARLGLDPASCLEDIALVVAATLKTAPANPYAWHISEFEAWNDLGRFEPPPFTGLLAVLALAAERMRGDEHYSAQNYYERLFEVLGTSSDTQKNRLKQHAQFTRLFWEGLNRWLAENDFDYGRQTAKPVNGWEYAGYALSQALVRKADRARLHQCFAQYGLAPHERLTDAEMTQYLHDWMRGPQPSAWLKRIWASADIRPRVAAAACAELEAWEGLEDAGQDAFQRRRLSWAAVLQTFPAPGLRMFLSAAGDEDEGVGGLTLSDEASPAARAAFAACSGDLWLTPSAHGALAVLEPVREIALSPLMLASFELQAAASGLSFSRAARPVVPLVKLDSGAYFREVSRASFLRPHLVLCHAEWRQRVARLLQSTARPGYREWQASQLRGLPEDWVLYSDVQILRRAETSDDHLSALTPLAEGIAIEMTGGLRLSQGLYHASAAPEVTATASEGQITLRLVDPAGETLRERNMGSPLCRLDLASAESYGAVNLSLEVSSGGKVRHESPLAFRSAETPKRLQDPAGRHAYQVPAPAGALSALPLSSEPGVTVSGMLVQGGCEQQDSGAAALEPLNESYPAEDEAFGEGGEDYRLHRVEGLHEACILRGHHYWLIDEFKNGADPDAPIWKTCRDCRNRILTPANRLRTAAFGKRKGAAAQVKPGASPPKMNARVQTTVAPELVFDALCYLGYGTWRRFQDIVCGTEGETLTAHVWAANLVALGLLDITLDQRLRSPVAWSVPPPALVFAGPQSAFFSGFRNGPLMSEALTRLAAAGAQAARFDQAGAPPAHLLSGLGLAAARHALEGLRDAHGRPVEVVASPAAAIAAAHPSVSTLQTLMGVIRIEDPKELKQFEPASGRWRTADRLEPGGAYRTDYAGRRYIFVHSGGAMRDGPHWLVKLLAARAAGVRLHGYDPGQQAFQAVLGCDLPPLLQRALVSCSGRLPHRSGGKLIFTGVPPAEAASVLDRLYT